MWATIDAAIGGANSGANGDANGDAPPIPCGIEAAAPHMQCTWATQQSMPHIAGFPESLVQISGVPGTRRTSTGIRTEFSCGLGPGELMDTEAVLSQTVANGVNGCRGAGCPVPRVCR